MSQSLSYFDLIVIGAGPGGYTGAIRAAQLGMKVAIIDKRRTLGGTCLNIGCIPSKALLDSSELYAQAKEHFSAHGIQIAPPILNLQQMLSRKDNIVAELTRGIDFLMQKNKITVYHGQAELKSQQEVSLISEDGSQIIINGKNILLATGSEAVELPFLKFDHHTIVSSTDALNFTSVPEHLIIIGGGVIGLELGSVWLRLGAKVTVIEFLDHICGGMDRKMSKLMQRILTQQGFTFRLSSKVTGGKVQDDKCELSIENMKTQKTESLIGNKVLVAVGRRPFSEGLGLENIGVIKNETGQVVIDDHFHTNIPTIYAIGDLVRGPMLAHKAEEEGVAVAEILAGQAGHVNYLTVPGVIYTWPEMASVGFSEEQLVEKNIEYNVGQFPFVANGRAKAHGMTDGQVKILADNKTDKVLGVHIIGPRASDLIAEAVIAMEFGASSEDIARSFHAHPTFPEAIREAALAVDKRARQL